MSFFKKIFNNEKKEENVFLVPINGELIKIEDIPDPVFAGKMMGDGFGIIPEDGKVYAPTNCEVVSVFPTLHAMGFKMDNGVEFLIHFGIDTVKLNGEGFNSHIKEGDKVSAGDLLLEVDIDSIKDKVPSIVTPIIFTNLNNKEFTIANYGKHEAQKKDVIIIK